MRGNCKARKFRKYVLGIIIIIIHLLEQLKPLNVIIIHRVCYVLNNIYRLRDMQTNIISLQYL